MSGTSRTHTAGETLEIRSVGMNEGGLFITLADGRGLALRNDAVPFGELREAMDGGGLRVRSGSNVDQFLVEIRTAPPTVLVTLDVQVAPNGVNATAPSAAKGWMGEGAWLRAAEHFIPASMLEPWYGDLQESRKRMVREGKSTRYIRFATTSQVTLLALNWLKLLSLETFERLVSGIARAAK